MQEVDKLDIVNDVARAYQSLIMQVDIIYISNLM